MIVLMQCGVLPTKGWFNDGMAPPKFMNSRISKFMDSSISKPACWCKRGSVLRCLGTVSTCEVLFSCGLAGLAGLN